MEHLGTPSIHTEEDTHRGSKPKTRPVTSILEWAQCFGIYVAVISRSQPERVPDMLAYQALIIQAQMEYQGDSWLSYDRTFRLRAASKRNLDWSAVDPTLWSLAFSGKGKSNGCKHCFSPTHSSTECSWNPEAQSSSRMNTHAPELSEQPARRLSRVCYDWNNSPSPSCSYPFCKYLHKCAICVRVPGAADTNHKALYCPYRTDRVPQRSSHRSQKTQPPQY